MFRLFPRPRLPKDIADEVSSLCHASQIERLAAPKGLLKDIGLDCETSAPSDLSRHSAT